MPLDEAARPGQLYVRRGESGSLSEDPGWPRRPPQGECCVRAERAGRTGAHPGLLYALRDGDLPGRGAGGGPQAHPALSAGERHLDRPSGRRRRTGRDRVWVRSCSPTRCSARSRAPARSDLRWSWSMLWTRRRPASTRRMASCDCRTRFGWCCRCVLQAGGLNDERSYPPRDRRRGSARGSKKALASASGEARRRPKRAFCGGVRRRPLRPVAR